MTDSLYRLLRAQLTTDNPLLYEQLITCEYRRLYDRLGPAEAERRTGIVQDTAFTPRDAEARRRVRTALAGHQVVLSNTSCTPAGVANVGRPAGDRLIAIVAREVDAGHDLARSCPFRCEVLRLYGRGLTASDITPVLGRALRQHQVTSRVDASALVDQALDPNRAACRCAPNP